MYTDDSTISLVFFGHSRLLVSNTLYLLSYGQANALQASTTKWLRMTPILKAVMLTALHCSN